MKYAVVFACTAALVSALRLPLPRAANENNQVDRLPAQGPPGKSCEEQGGTITWIVCSGDKQSVPYKGQGSDILRLCCLSKTAPAQDQKAPPESASVQGPPDDKKKSCEEQGGRKSLACSVNEKSITYNATFFEVLCCVPKTPPA
ncbi:hypothetical protein MGU_07784 [Metarhizium guizhouense ARSEF 977]|uniref:Secreted protein n=1 Tax=Metarhizium guizhouense (strain ARSEF 977) TaxID=1276136 RepID=A0A0B4H5D8_METGA|nr:hypothetical protein MGU_07784 [Metarhizium guizhouense ARSEF 977]